MGGECPMMPDYGLNVQAKRFEHELSPWKNSKPKNANERQTFEKRLMSASVAARTLEEIKMKGNSLSFESVALRHVLGHWEWANSNAGDRSNGKITSLTVCAFPCFLS